MNAKTTWICAIANRVLRWFHLRSGQQLWPLSAIVLAMAVGVAGAAAAQRAPSMGPLSEFLFEGRDGVWQAAIRDGVERGSEIEWSLDGQTLGSLGNSELGRGLVGIVAMGTGTFAFRGFEVSETGANRRRPMHRARRGLDEASQVAEIPPAANASVPGSRSVQITDQSLKLPIWRETVPAGWEVFQQVATDLSRGGYTAYLRDLYGPRGELIRDLGSTTYNSAVGLSADLIIQQAVATTVEQPKIGQARPSEMMESLWVVALKRRGEQQQGRTLETYEIPFEGLREGKPVKGVLYLMHTPFPQLGDAGFMELSLIVSPPEHLAQTLQTNEDVLRSRDLSGDYLERKQRHNQLASQRNQVDHQNRMAQLRANHEAHQSRMRDVYAASDARHEAWVNSNLRAPTSSGQYGGQAAFVDQIHERTTFNDPYSGQEVHQDGQRDRWITNGLGDYYGTDDPSFDRHSLQGDWQVIEPSRLDGR